MIVAVAEESRGVETARPWIEAAAPEYWSLIDPGHEVGDHNRGSRRAVCRRLENERLGIRPAGLGVPSPPLRRPGR